MPLLRHPQDRQILRLALPALGALVAEPLYRLADTAVVGHLGTDALAGLAIATTVLLVGYSLFIFLAYGTTAAVARLLGAGDEAGAAHQAVQGIWLAVGVGVVLAGAGLVAAEPLVGLLGGEGAVADSALTYLRISLLGLPAMLVSLAGTGYLRGLQDTRTPLVVAVGTATGNLVLELVLIVGLGFGIGASALSTVVAEVAAAAVYTGFVIRAVRRHDVRLSPEVATIRRLGVVGGDLFVRTAALRASLVIATAVAARFGAVSLAAHQIAFELWTLLALVMDAIAIAGQALTGRYLGAADAVGARQAGERMLVWGLVAGVVLGAALVGSAWVLPSVFTDDAAVIATTTALLVVAGLTQPVNGPVFVLDGILIGAGDMRYLAKAMALSFAGYLPLVGAVWWLDAGVTWLWVALGGFMVLRLVTLGLRWRGDRWLVLGAGA